MTEITISSKIQLENYIRLCVNGNNALYTTASFILDNLLLHEIDIVK